MMASSTTLKLKLILFALEIIHLHTSKYVIEHQIQMHDDIIYFTWTIAYLKFDNYYFSPFRDNFAKFNSC